MAEIALSVALRQRRRPVGRSVAISRELADTVPCGAWQRRGNIVKDSLLGRVILVVEDEPLIALDVRTVLEAAGAMVVHATARHAAQAADDQQSLSAAILDLRPGSSDHRPIARRLKDRGIPFLFYSTHPPEDVTTVRGAPVVLKPGRPDEIVMAVALLLRAGRA
jgi:DNA-binding response OmpR family regulator